MSADSFACIGRLPDGRLVRGCDRNRIFGIAFCVGMVLPTSTSLALALERKNSGNASAMLGFFQFTFAGLVAPLVGLGEVSVATSWVIVIASCATCGLVGLLLMATSHTFFRTHHINSFLIVRT